MEHFNQQLVSLRKKMNKKRDTIKELVTKVMVENEKELHKWKDYLFTIVDETLDEKIAKLDHQVFTFRVWRFARVRVVCMSLTACACSVSG
jgi:hypothetical protein